MKPSPKPEPRTRAKARAQRLQAAADRRVHDEVNRRDGYCCTVCGLYCGKSIDHHHKVFRSQGGANTVDNLVSLCRRCHSDIHLRRGDTDTAEAML